MVEVEATLAKHGLGHSALLVERRADSEFHGMIRGVIPMPASTCRFAISEVIDMGRGRDPRREYSSYFLAEDHRTIWAWDRDLSKPIPMQDHHHPVGRTDEREAGTVSLDGALTYAWETVSALAELRL